MTFSDCVQACFENRAFCEQFDRLTMSNICQKGTPLEIAIDQAAGRLELDCELFVQVVRDVIWERLQVE